MSSLLIGFLRQFMIEGALEVTTANGRRHTIGSAAEPSPAIRFADHKAEFALLTNPALAFGELYVAGRLLITRGSLYELIELVTRNLTLQPKTKLSDMRRRLRLALRDMSHVNCERRAKRNVAHHYDLDGRLYDLFLDADRQYSCAYFEHIGQDLADAQLAKKRHIAAKLLVEPGHRVLDIGSGWGGLAIYLAEQCQAKVTGVTLSDEQLGIARKRASSKALTNSVIFQLKDYRAVQGTFDRIVSVGMFEHVGIARYDEFFTKAANLLTNDGVMLLHSIGSIDGPCVNNPWVTKYIFPGGYTPALSEVLPAIERAGLIVTDIEILRLHYADTLKAWRERFTARRVEAEAIYDEEFFRLWEFYLAGCEAGFRHGGLMVFQIQISKRLDTVPLTRNYVGEREMALRSHEQKWSDEKVAAE